MNVSVGQLKRDLSSLLNQVAYGNERVVIESRGRAKAVLISIEELERLEGRHDCQGRRRRTDELLRRLDALRSRQGGTGAVDLAEDLRSMRERRSSELGGGG